MSVLTPPNRRRMPRANLRRMPKSNLRRMPKAFTMMEVLIASALLALVGALLLTSMSSSMDAKEAVEQTSDRFHQVRQAMTRMVDEISMAYISRHRNAPVLRYRTRFMGERDALNFTAFGNVARKVDAKQSDQRELGYSLGTDRRTGTESIIRRVQPNPGLEIDEGGREQTLIPDVTELEFQYWDPITQDWKETWDSEESATLDRLPPRVRITFTARLADGSEQTFTTQTRIFLDRPLNFRL